MTCSSAASALYNFAREHGAAIERLPFLRPLLRLLSALAGLWATLRRRARQAGHALSVRLASRQRRPAREASAGRRRFTRLGSLSPREMIQYYYLSTVRRAAKAGLRRRPSQTPEEYSAGLRKHVPEVDQDLGALTSAFVEARYSVHPMNGEYARGLRPYWQRVKQELRRLHRR